ncbi:unnamed protein product, partial [Chrysoparadoxa australica]
ASRKILQGTANPHPGLHCLGQCATAILHKHSIGTYLGLITSPLLQSLYLTPLSSLSGLRGRKGNQ